MQFNELYGKTLESLDCEVDGDHATFTTVDGETAHLIFDQRPDLSMVVASIEGDLSQLIGLEIEMAYEHFDPPHGSGLALGRYQLQTYDGTVEIAAVFKDH